MEGTDNDTKRKASLCQMACNWHTLAINLCSSTAPMVKIMVFVLLLQPCKLSEGPLETLLRVVQQNLTHPERWLVPLMFV